MIRQPKVLLLTSDHQERRELEEILENHALLACASDLLELKSHLQEGSVDVVFCSWPFYLGSWNGILREVQDQHPDLPVIVLSPSGGEREWMEVMESGVFDLLTWPSPRPWVLAAVEQAAESHDARKLGRFLGELAAQQLAS